MSLDTMHISLQKAKAILEAANPLHLDELSPEQVRWLVHAAADYVQESLGDLEQEMRRCRPQ